MLHDLRYKPSGLGLATYSRSLRALLRFVSRVKRSRYSLLDDPTMPHQDREDVLEERPSERRQRIKSEKDPNRKHKSSRSSRPKAIDPETGEVIRTVHTHRRRKDKEADSEPSISIADIVPEIARTSSAPGSISRSSLPYPSFSKAHSKEAVNSIEHLPTPVVPKPNPYTPDSTDLGSDNKPRAKSADGLERGAQNLDTKDGRPPSPPDTDFTQRRKSTPIRPTQIREEEDSQPRPGSQGSHLSWFSHTPGKESRSKLSTKSRESKASKTSTAIRSSKTKPVPRPAVVEIIDADDASDLDDDARSTSALDSNATSVTTQRNQNVRADARHSVNYNNSSPDSAQDSSPRTPTATPGFSAPPYKPAPSPFVSFDLPDSQDDAYDSPQPPPPPPPPMVPINVPRVDYLMQNGGLPRTVPKSLLAVTPSPTPQPTTGRPAGLATPDVDQVFGPFHNLLDQYEAVIAKNGSIAVATGYRSVARRLLDRLEAVFARDLSSEGCFCIICQQDNHQLEVSKGLGWGEVLEWVSWKRDLPPWPAFDFSQIGAKEGDFPALGISGHQRINGGPARAGSIVNMDPDIAEEFREHYLKQSKKTRNAVDKWLSSTPAALTAPPPDVDDETLTFTILTHLDQEDRPIFNALLNGSSRPKQSASRAPTPLGKPRSDFIVQTVQSIQRLYRLPEPPRDPEACIYLLKNPHVHNLLATLSGINASEWEILTSGRFDGFLWSGAEPEFHGSMLNSPSVSRNPTPAPMGLPSPGPTPAGRHPSFSRTNTPFNMRNQTFSPAIAGFPSRGPTPASLMAPMSIPGTPAIGQNRGPVSNDEEAEIAVLSELELEIYKGMEALEDAFEALHRKAEYVRQALRQRSAGLSMAAQARRSSNDNGIYSRLGTPGFGGSTGNYGTDSEYEAESDWGGDDNQSELAPDDSASNISSSRHRRPKRRNERRTPAPLEEVDEDVY